MSKKMPVLFIGHGSPMNAIETNIFVQEWERIADQDVVHYRSAGEVSEQAFYTPEHFYPLLYVLGASEASDSLTIFNDSCIFGSLSMTCYLFGQ